MSFEPEVMLAMVAEVEGKLRLFAEEHQIPDPKISSDESAGDGLGWYGVALDWVRSDDIVCHIWLQVGYAHGCGDHPVIADFQYLATYDQGDQRYRIHHDVWSSYSIDHTMIECLKAYQALSQLTMDELMKHPYHPVSLSPEEWDRIAEKIRRDGAEYAAQQQAEFDQILLRHQQC